MFSTQLFGSPSLSILRSDIGACVGKATAQPYFYKTLDWLKHLFDREDRLEREEWGDETRDENGKAKETMAMYARKHLF